MRLIVLCFSLFIVSVACAQPCKRTSVYFDLNEAKLKKEAKPKLDSLAELLEEQDFLVELYGYTDSLSSYEYNRKLAARRMDAVKEYLLKAGPTKYKIVFREKNNAEQGDSKSTAATKDLALDRRVDIFLIPVSNGKIQIDDGRNATAEAGLDFFEPCGVCASATRLDVYYNETEAARANIVLETTDGEPLVTAGSFILRTNPCAAEKANNNDSVTVRICTAVPDTGMSLWDADTVNGKIYWKPSRTPLQFDPKTGCYTAKMKRRVYKNLDRKRRYGTRRDSLQRIISQQITLPTTFLYEHAIQSLEPYRDENNVNDTLPVLWPDKPAVLRSFTQLPDNTYGYFTGNVSSLPVRTDSAKKERIYIYHYYELNADRYTPFAFSDTAVNIRVRKSIHIKSAGYYLPEFNDFIPFDKTDHGFAGNVLQYESKLALLRNKKLYVADAADLPLKYKSKKKTYRLKVNRKNFRQFHPAKGYPVKKPR